MSRRNNSDAKSAPAAVKHDAMLPLDVPRSIALKSAAATFTYHLRRVGLEDWRNFYSAIVHQKLRVDGQLVDVFESESALVELVENAIVRVEGYTGIDQVQKWKQALPLQHKLAIGLALRSVSVAKSKAPSSLLCDLVEVKLDAAWATEGKTMLYEGLVHRFRHPSLEQLKKFNFEAARVVVRGDGENGISFYPSRQAIAMKIYDELIDSVEGYSVGGVALTGIDAIKREMDGAHKATAALEMFAAGEGVEIK